MAASTSSSPFVSTAKASLAVLMRALGPSASKKTHPCMHAYVAPNSRLGKETLHAVFSPFDVFSAESCNQSSDHLCGWLRGTHILLEIFDAEENVACTILDREVDEAHGVCIASKPSIYSPSSSTDSAPKKLLYKKMFPSRFSRKLCSLAHKRT